MGSHTSSRNKDSCRSQINRVTGAHIREKKSDLFRACTLSSKRLALPTKQEFNVSTEEQWGPWVLRYFWMYPLQ